MKLRQLSASKYFLRSNVRKNASVARNIMYSAGVVDYFKSTTIHALYSVGIH